MPEPTQRSPLFQLCRVVRLAIHTLKQKFLYTAIYKTPSICSFWLITVFSLLGIGVVMLKILDFGVQTLLPHFYTGRSEFWYVSSPHWALEVTFRPFSFLLVDTSRSAHTWHTHSRMFTFSSPSICFPPCHIHHCSLMLIPSSLVSRWSSMLWPLQKVLFVLPQNWVSARWAICFELMPTQVGAGWWPHKASTPLGQAIPNCCLTTHLLLTHPSTINCVDL